MKGATRSMAGPWCGRCGGGGGRWTGAAALGCGTSVERAWNERGTSVRNERGTWAHRRDPNGSHVDVVRVIMCSFMSNPLVHASTTMCYASFFIINFVL